MTNTISPQTRARIDSLLREIAAGQHMDADTIDELRAHMEEKLLDYMRGEIPVSEDDAFVLVREHFGKPEVIRAMYQETRRRFSPQLFIRWFGAAVVALFMVTELERWLTLFVKWVVKSSWDSIQNPELLAYHAMYFLDSALDMLMICVGAIALFMVLRSWRSAEEQGENHVVSTVTVMAIGCADSMRLVSCVHSRAIRNSFTWNGPFPVTSI